MTINQLFKNKPCLNLVNKLINFFGLKDIDDTKIFSRKDLENLKTPQNIKTLEESFKNYYLPCKFKVYFKNLDSKKCITILRQCIRLYNYKLISKEKYIKSEKIIIYRVSPVNKIKNEPKKNIGCIISFD